jgi:hypothetical protein
MLIDRRAGDVRNYAARYPFGVSAVTGAAAECLAA